MPGVYRYSLDKIEKLTEKAIKNKIPMIALFPSVPTSKKNIRGTEALNKNNLICKALKLIKRNFNDVGVMCDVALDPYTSHGHDGILKDDYVDNDETVKILIKQGHHVTVLCEIPNYPQGKYFNGYKRKWLFGVDRRRKV